MYENKLLVLIYKKGTTNIPPMQNYFSLANAPRKNAIAMLSVRTIRI
jgi:hypothetical protein